MIVYIVFSSEHGHVYTLAKAIADGAQSVDGASVKIFQTEPLSREEVVEGGDGGDQGKRFAHVPVITAWELAGADAVIFGAPSKLGMMAAPMRNLLDQTGPLWADGALLGKVGSVFTSTTTGNGSQESPLTSFHATLLRLGMIIVGVPYSENRLLSVDALPGINPNSKSTRAGSDETNRPSESGIEIARFQGQHVAEITRLLLLGKERANGGR
jgi:NAD(P)H dehydrogenase (quinone)